MLERQAGQERAIATVAHRQSRRLHRSRAPSASLDQRWMASIVLAERGSLLVACLALGAQIVANVEAQSRIALAVIAVLALAAWLLTRWRHHMILDGAELIRRFNVNVLGATPALSAQQLRSLPPKFRTPENYVMEFPASTLATAYRDLAETIFSVGKKGAVIAVLAPRVRDGGPSQALALARILSARGKRIVVIDCDLRLRTLTRAAHLTPENGVVEAINRSAALPDCIEADPCSDAHILGASDAGAFAKCSFESAGFTQILETLGRDFDAVILSAPSAFGQAAARSIIARASLCLMVVRKRKSPAPVVRAALQMIRRIQPTPAYGVLFTDA